MKTLINEILKNLLENISKRQEQTEENIRNKDKVEE
jgi:hypothetical protein